MKLPYTQVEHAEDLHMSHRDWVHDSACESYKISFLRAGRPSLAGQVCSGICGGPAKCGEGLPAHAKAVSYPSVGAASGLGEPHPSMTCQDANWHETLGSPASQLFALIEASLQRPEN